MSDPQGMTGSAQPGSTRKTHPEVVDFPFWKVDGAGNDFVLIDARRGRPPSIGPGVVRRLLDRNRGVGGDGLLLLLPAERPLATQVRYWNADGGVAEFCGNGARCVARYLFDSRYAGSGTGIRLGSRLAPRLGPRIGSRTKSEPMSEIGFRLSRVEVRARDKGGARIAVRHPIPRELAIPKRPPRGPAGTHAVWIDSGVPHWILPVRGVDRFDLARWGPPIRSSAAFGKRGSNVDAVEFRDGVLHVRTWERGVEGETQACGSGILAAAFWAWKTKGARFPLRLRSRSGAQFRAYFDPEFEPGSKRSGIWLEGPARLVFRGLYPLTARRIDTKAKKATP